MVVGFAGIARTIDLVNVGVFEADPVDEAAVDAIVLGELIVFVYNNAVEQTIVG